MDANTQTMTKLVSPEYAANFLDTSTNTLANWRCTGRYTLPYVKVGRMVRYRTSDLEAFVQAGSVIPQAEAKE